MNVRPTSTGPAARQSEALRRPNRTEDAAPSAPSSPPGGDDRVELSDAARELLATPRSSAAARSIQPERMRVVLARVASGYYDRPEVREQILARLEAHLVAPD